MKKCTTAQSLRQAIKLRILTNVILSVLVLSIGALCVSPLEPTVQTDGKENEVYRSAGSDAKGVSLMINVYWGTEEVFQMLDILEKHEAKATFFIGGCWADDNVSCLKEIAKRGHEIGNHGYFHKDQDKLNVAQNVKEISDCNQFIQLALGVQPTLFAPPSGAYSENTLSACKQLTMTTILWSKDTIDWRDKNAALIYQRATKNVQIGDFILMHPMKETVAALDDILKYYQTHGLKAVTVSQNLQKEG